MPIHVINRAEQKHRSIERLAVNRESSPHGNGLRWHGSPQIPTNRQGNKRHWHDGQQKGAQPKLKGRHEAILPRLPFGKEGQVFDGDEERIKTLQQWFGYNLIADNRQHKLAMLIGPPRSGKGTTMAILSAMLGNHNVANSSLASLGGRFGLEPLVGKLAALIDEGHLGKFTDTALVLAHIDIAEKSNEIPAAQTLLAELGVPSSAIVTLDALHCQKNISRPQQTPTSP